VWTIPTNADPDVRNLRHAACPKELARIPILASTRESDVVLDIFVGSGTTTLVAKEHGRHYIGIDSNPDYVKLAQSRLA
jgi:site-specific DNA-methyltransferase (adenine-specific)